MRALVLAGLLVASLVTVPPAQAVKLCNEYVGEVWEFQKCAIRVLRPGYNPPSPPAPGSPPTAFRDFIVDFAEYMLYSALCVSIDPPEVQSNEDCGAEYFLRKHTGDGPYEPLP